MPMELGDLDLTANLLTDTFGVWECCSTDAFKVRVIDNYKSNGANDYAWMPKRLQYCGFGELRETLAILHERWAGDLQLGKLDFQSAVKTLPAAEDQSWLCWALVFNCELSRSQVVPVQYQSFGSLGAVMALRRAAAHGVSIRARSLFVCR